jgi:hypothetical protein
MYIKVLVLIIYINNIIKSTKVFCLSLCRGPGAGCPRAWGAPPGARRQPILPGSAERCRCGPLSHQVDGLPLQGLPGSARGAPKDGPPLCPNRGGGAGPPRQRRRHLLARKSEQLQFLGGLAAAPFLPRVFGPSPVTAPGFARSGAEPPASCLSLHYW